MVNSISVVLFIVLLAVAAFSAAMGSYYYSTLSESLKQKAENAMRAIAEGARTGKEGDGVIYMVEGLKGFRVRTGESL